MKIEQLFKEEQRLLDHLILSEHWGDKKLQELLKKQIGKVNKQIKKLEKD